MGSVQRKLFQVNSAKAEFNNTTITVAVWNAMSDIINGGVWISSASGNAWWVTTSKVNSLIFKEIKELVGHLNFFLTVFKMFLLNGACNVDKVIISFWNQDGGFAFKLFCLLLDWSEIVDASAWSKACISESLWLEADIQEAVFTAATWWLSNKQKISVCLDQRWEIFSKVKVKLG